MLETLIVILIKGSGVLGEMEVGNLKR